MHASLVSVKVPDGRTLSIYIGRSGARLWVEEAELVSSDAGSLYRVPAENGLPAAEYRIVSDRGRPVLETSGSRYVLGTSDRTRYSGAALAYLVMRGVLLAGFAGAWGLGLAPDWSMWSFGLGWALLGVVLLSVAELRHRAEVLDRVDARGWIGAGLPVLTMSVAYFVMIPFIASRLGR